jgi:hypothetical protein
MDTPCSDYPKKVERDALKPSTSMGKRAVTMEDNCSDFVEILNIELSNLPKNLDEIAIKRKYFTKQHAVMV